MARCSWLALLLFLGTILGCCVAGRVPEAVQGLVVRGDHLRGSGGPAAAEAPSRPSQQQAHPAAAVDADSSNIEYAVDYSDEDDDGEGDPLMSEDSDDRALEVMTFTTYFPGRDRHPPCPHHRQQHARPAVAAAHAATSTALSSAAQSRAVWRHAQQVAARLAAAGAFEVQELIDELEVTLDSMGDAAYDDDGVLAWGHLQDSSDPIDHRWEQFDGGLWSQEAADYIDPSQYVSGLDDYEPPSSDGSSDSDGAELLQDSGDYEQLLDGLLPALPAPLPPGRSTDQQQQDTLDIGLLVAAEDNAANNLLLFGVRTPEEVAAAAAAAGPAVHWTSSSSSWASMLEYLTQAPSSPSVEAQQAAVVLLVGCTLMMFVVFLSSVADLRAAVAQEGSSEAAAAAGGSSTRRSAAPFAGRLRTRKQSAFPGCGVVAAAVCAGCAGGAQQGGEAAADDDLSMPLLLDVEEEFDVEAALLQPRPAAMLPPAFQKFFNPMHYQALPDSE